MDVGKTESRTKGIVIGTVSVALTAAVAWVLVGAAAYENDHRAAYDTGSSYQVAGHVVKAAETLSGPEFLPDIFRIRSYDVVIEAEGLPNGNAAYNSNRQNDWIIAKDASESQSSTFTIGQGGYLEDEEIELPSWRPQHFL